MTRYVSLANILIYYFFWYKSIWLFPAYRYSGLLFYRDINGIPLKTLYQPPCLLLGSIYAPQGVPFFSMCHSCFPNINMSGCNLRCSGQYWPHLWGGLRELPAEEREDHPEAAGPPHQEDSGQVAGKGKRSFSSFIQGRNTTLVNIKKIESFSQYFLPKNK